MSDATAEGIAAYLNDTDPDWQLASDVMRSFEADEGASLGRQDGLVADRLPEIGHERLAARSSDHTPGR